MEISNRLPKERQFGRKNKKDRKYKRIKDYKVKNLEVTLRGGENLCHSKLREMQRYGTCNIKLNKIIKAISQDNSVTIKKEKDTVISLVRYSSRYYIAVMGTKNKKVIKTFLPDNIPNFLDYVQELIDKENSQVILKAA